MDEKLKLQDDSDPSDNEEYLLEEFKAAPKPIRITAPQRRNLLGLLIASLIANVLLSTVALIHVGTGKITNRMATELASLEPYVEYRPTRFNTSMFQDEDPLRQVSPYEGPFTPETEKAWEGFISRMNFGLDKDEAKELPLPTVQSWDNPEVYPVNLAVFHHLHCLLRLKRIVYGQEDPQNETDTNRINHTDHCIEDIRNALMCHADMTPIPLFYTLYSHKSHRPLAYDSRMNVPHTCRNWDLLMDWVDKGKEKMLDLPHWPGP